MQLKKMRLTGITRAALAGVILVGLVVAAAMVVAQRGPAVLAKMTTAASDAEAAPAPPPAPAANRVSAPEAQAAGRIKQTTPARAALTKPGSKPALVMASATTPVTVAPAKTAAAEALEVITITGCLQHDEGEFRLTDAIGVNAPKARSWKSGFLKKRAASLEIVDSANRLRLPTHVGQKVSVTGILLDREVRARSVQRLGVCS